jgi:hypothetical protein
MATKILKVGTDVLTINNEVTSIKETFPYYRINGQLSDQYYNALDEDIRAKFDITEFNNYVSKTNAGNATFNYITAPNGSLYSVPAQGAEIVKITPNPADFANPTITKIGSLGTRLNKFASAHVIGDYIYYVPYLYESVIQLNWKTDTITTWFAFSNAVYKWGAADIGDDGKIWCPPYNSNEWLVIDVSDPNNLTYNLITRLQSNLIGSVNGGDGYIYTQHNSTSASYYNTRMEISTGTESVITGSNLGNATRSMGLCNPFRYKNIIFYKSYYGVILFNILSQSFTFTNIGATNLYQYTPCLGADGWLYYSQDGANSNSFRINVQNFTVDYLAYYAADQGSGLGVDFYGNMYQGKGNDVRIRVNVSNQANPILTADRVCSRYVNH